MNEELAQNRHGFPGEVRFSWNSKPCSLKHATGRLLMTVAASPYDAPGSTFHCLIQGSPMLKKILLGLVVVVVALAGFIASRPSTYSVQRSATIQASPD